MVDATACDSVVEFDETRLVLSQNRGREKGIDPRCAVSIFAGLIGEYFRITFWW